MKPKAKPRKRIIQSDMMLYLVKQVLIIVAVILLLMIAMYINGWNRSKDWETTPAIIVPEVFTNDGGEFHKEKAYYEIDFNRYPIEIFYFGGHPPRFGEQGYRVEPDQLIYYDPENPSDHSVYRHASWMIYVCGILVVVIIIFTMMINRPPDEDSV